MMTDIPVEIIAEIERDVERYRNVRLNAARKRLTPEYRDRLAKRGEYQFLNVSRDALVKWFADGETIDAIAGRFRFIKAPRIKQEIWYWLFERLNPWTADPVDPDKYYRSGTSVPRYSDEGWRETVRDALRRPAR
jgi:hypothetical protein